MSRAVQAQLEPAYVIHRRPWQESSLIVDLFSLNFGRVSAVARGGNSSRRAWKAQLQPFQPLKVTWVGRGELKTLSDVEIQSAPMLVKSTPLYSGLYANELIQKLLPQADPSPDLFAAYIELLQRLAANEDVEPVLRRFEWSLVKELGLSFEWHRAADTNEAVYADQSYGFDPQLGIVQTAQRPLLLTGIPGAALLAIAADDYSSPMARKVAKSVMRVLINDLLDGRTLHSRSLFMTMNGERHER